jgi:glutathione S-transferase
VQIFHLTTADQWASAKDTGLYTVSTRGRTLGQEGYIHCSFRDQVDGVRQRSYSDLDDVLLLVIETDLLASPWQAEQLPNADATYPHIYGPLNLDAVVDVREL